MCISEDTGDAVAPTVPQSPSTEIAETFSTQPTVLTSQPMTGSNSEEEGLDPNVKWAIIGAGLGVGAVSVLLLMAFGLSK